MPKDDVSIILVSIAIAASLLGYSIYTAYLTPAATGIPAPAAVRPEISAPKNPATATDYDSRPLTIIIYCVNSSCQEQQTNAGAGTLARGCFRDPADCRAAQAATTTTY